MLADDLRTMAPRESDWFTLDARRVKAFADATDDWQDIHLDAEFASKTPFGGTIAHGFLTLSMLSAMSYQVTKGLTGFSSSVNYGFDRVRFVSPVRVGRRVRGRFSVAGVDEGESWLDVHWDVEVEKEGETRPALVANWITRFYLAEG
ncbi:MaoC family dehydratase [Sagittula stellata]|uniref:NodN-like protein n=1 Tax=Sagittula stellata (strain ATCC 700073 / DSM 11524 / E-37) TaxID=388399 RepID=A3K3I0_SAGS3|nr:MaoC family dehydratase [Sagittula stellata]EBA08094.1 nodN-like protein [Sagittula stellata E-37]